MKLRDLFKGTPAHPAFMPAVDILETERLEPATEAPPTPPLPNGLTDPQCTATTRKGTRCKFPSAPGTDRCTLPSHQSPVERFADPDLTQRRM